MTTNWVITGEYQSFPLMHHWRVLSEPAPKITTPEDLKEIEDSVGYWENSIKISERLQAIPMAFHIKVGQISYASEKVKSLSMSKIQWTRSKARLTRISRETNSSLNWIFVPGGPGLGSESFEELTNQIKLPGVIWYFDFPGDGSNRLKNVQFSGTLWKEALLEAIDLFDHPILVAHSFGGMFALSVPELGKRLGGLVLMNSSPSQEWMRLFANYAKSHPSPELEQAKQTYAKTPSDQTFKEFTLIAAPYFFTDLSLKNGLALLSKLPYSHESYDWAQTHFHPNYKAKLALDGFPVLVLGSELDFLTPLSLFSNDPRFIKDNIRVVELKGAGHFPWIGNFKLVEEELNAFGKRFKVKKKAKA